jgi:hypothetical protein
MPETADMAVTAHELRRGDVFVGVDAPEYIVSGKTFVAHMPTIEDVKDSHEKNVTVTTQYGRVSIRRDAKCAIRREVNTAQENAAEHAVQIAHYVDRSLDRVAAWADIDVRGALDEALKGIPPGGVASRLSWQLEEIMYLGAQIEIGLAAAQVIKTTEGDDPERTREEAFDIVMGESEKYIFQHARMPERSTSVMQNILDRLRLRAHADLLDNSSVQYVKFLRKQDPTT